MPLKWYNICPKELIEDPMLTLETAKEFQDTFKGLYKFSIVNLLSMLEVEIVSGTSWTYLSSFSLICRPY